MSEWIISDERLASINITAYRAGLYGSEVYTQVGADGQEVVRCRDCLSLCEAADGSIYCGDWMRRVPLDGFCFKGERRDA